jgi:hypothetical protein
LRFLICNDELDLHFERASKVEQVTLVQDAMSSEPGHRFQGRASPNRAAQETTFTPFALCDGDFRGGRTGKMILAFSAIVPTLIANAFSCRTI